MAKRKRKKSKVRGVWVVEHRNRPDAKPKLQARWIDPATGKQRSESLNGLNAEQREERLAEIGADLAEATELVRTAARRASMGLGSLSRMSIADAADRLIEAHEGTERGEEGLTAAGKLLKDWATERGVSTIGEVGRNALDDLRAWIVSRPRARRRNNCEADAPLRPATVNRHLAWLQWMFRRAAARGWCALDLTRDAVGECLEKAGGRNAGKADAPTMLRGEQYQSLFESALKVSADCATFAVWVAVSGARASEAHALTWGQVELDPQMNRVRVNPGKGVARLVSLRISPGMKSIFAAMRPADAADDSRVWTTDPMRSDEYLRRKWLEWIEDKGGPRVTWQQLRQSCASWLACTAGIFGDVAQAMGTAQLGHTYNVAAKYYLSHDRSLTQATSLDEAWGTSQAIKQIVAAITPQVA